MFAQRAVFSVARRAAVPRASFAARTFSSSVTRFNQGKWEVKPDQPQGKIARLQDINDPQELYGPGAERGTIASDLDQATGLERYELLGQLEGIDVFDMKPLDNSRKGTPQDPIVVKSGGEERYVGCSGTHPEAHEPIWVTLTRERPMARCHECGNTFKMDYIGPEDTHHGHGHGPEFEPQVDPKTFVDYVRPEYWYR